MPKGSKGKASKGKKTPKSKKSSVKSSAISKKSKSVKDQAQEELELQVTNPASAAPSIARSSQSSSLESFHNDDFEDMSDAEEPPRSSPIHSSAVASDDFKKPANSDSAPDSIDRREEENPPSNEDVEDENHQEPAENVSSDDEKESANPPSGRGDGSDSSDSDCILTGEEPAAGQEAAQDVTKSQPFKGQEAAKFQLSQSPPGSAQSKAKNFTQSSQPARSRDVSQLGEREQESEQKNGKKESGKRQELKAGKGKSGKNAGSEKSQQATQATKSQTSAADDPPAIQALVEQLTRQAKQIADLQGKLCDERKEVERMREDVEEVVGEKEALERTVGEQRALLEAPKPAPNPLENADFRQRFEWLVQKGWTLDEAGSALEATKQGGVYSSTRADVHLKAVSDRERLAAITKANELTASAQDEQLSISEDSSLARVLSKNSDAVDIIVKLKTTHAQMKARGAHTAYTAVGACNLVQLPSIQSDQRLARKGPLFLGQVALAVCEDCGRCKEQRDKMEAEHRERERARVAKEEAEAKKKKLQEEKEEEKRKKALNKPLSLNFRSSDSKRDVTLPRSLCANPSCGKGYDAGKWLYFCGNCKRGYHETHTEFTLVRALNGDEHFSCQACTDRRERAGQHGPGPAQMQVIGSDIENHKAPCHQEAADDRDQSEEIAHPSSGNVTEPRGGAVLPPVSPNSRMAPPTPPASDRGNSGSRRESTPLSSTEAYPPTTVQKELDFSSGNTIATGEKVKGPTVQMKEYLVWDAIPKDWKPTLKGGIPQENPTHGWGKAAYQNWRRKNIGLRDTHVAGSAARGPLCRAISPEIKTLVGTHLLLSPQKVSRFWTEWNSERSEDENVKTWCEVDPLFSWVDKLDDKTLLQLLDPHFGVEKADTFLARKFVPELPACNPNGDINYHSLDFMRWSIEWQSDLTELQRTGGSSLAGIDLRQTLLNALQGCSLLHKHASVLQAPSAIMLVAMIRKWTAEKDAETSARMQERATLLDQKASGGGAAAPAKALHSSAQGRDTPKSPSFKTPPSANLKICGRYDELYKCEGCGNVWKSTRVVPCSPNCRYEEHPEFNKDWKTKPYSRRMFLTWKDFRERFPHITNLPKDLLEYEAKGKAYQAKKRSGGESDDQPHNKKA